MASRGRRVVAFALSLLAAGAGAYLLWMRGKPAPIVGVVRTTQIRVAPEVGGQLATIKVHKGDRVRAGDVVAELSAVELTASVAQARAALAAATADRNNVYAGVRAEQIASLAAEIAKAKSRLEYAEQQLSRTATLARTDTATQQALDQAENDAATGRAGGRARRGRRAGRGRGGRARGPRATARQDQPACASRRHRQRDRCRGGR